MKREASLSNIYPQRQEPERVLHKESFLLTKADGGGIRVSLHLTSLLRRSRPSRIAQPAIGADKVEDQRARALSNTHQIEH